MAKQRKQRTQYSAKQREEILAAAQQNGLTALQVQKKYGVIPVTYYSWRKKAGLPRPNGRQGPIGSIRGVVRRRIQGLLPDIIRSEVTRYMNELFAHAPGKRARH